MHAPGKEWSTPNIHDLGPRVPNLQTALDLAAAGLPIFPAKVFKQGDNWTKKPLIKGWKQLATSDPSIIRGWWKEWPNAVPGIELGRADLVVLDPDRHADGPDGVAAFDKLVAENSELPHGPISLTAGGGFHYIFRQPNGEKLGNREGMLPDGICVRGAGGWIVAPGSRRPDGKYWQPANDDLGDAFKHGRIPAIPKWIEKIVRSNGHEHDQQPEKIKPPTTATSNGTAKYANRITAYFAATLERLAQELAATQPGRRNSKANDCAFRLGTLAHGNTKLWFAVETKLLAACFANGLVKADGKHAVFATLKSGFNAGLAKPAKHPEDRPRTGRHKQRREKSEPQAVPIGEPEFPDRSKGGGLQSTCANARVAIEALGIECRHDCFHDKLLVSGQALGRYAGELTDHVCLIIRRAMVDRFGFDPGKNHTFDAGIQLCLEHAFDPIVDYLGGLKWDGVRRIDIWLSTYLGAPDTPLNRAIGKLALAAMVRRARQPGSKFDQIIVLEGVEGTLKSTALNVLAGTNENFSDQTVLGQRDREQQELLRGIWVYEIADLTGIKRAEVDHVKAFASRTHDRARRAYDRAVIQQPRRCVIFATTNDEVYLKSQTGNRRFWPIRTVAIDIKALHRDRDQLFAEAAAVEATGISLVHPRRPKRYCRRGTNHD